MVNIGRQTLVGLGPEFADRYPHQLSGGQARRFGVARALALEPALLIADEPTAGLDMSIQGEVLNLLSSLQHRMGLSVLVIIHNLNIVRHVADHMAIMYLGRFVEQGTSSDVLATYRKIPTTARPNWHWSRSTATTSAPTPGFMDSTVAAAAA